ncbi:MAG: LPS export ABC transporter permease LptF [Alphaproteobacteria bacterium]
MNPMKEITRYVLWQLIEVTLFVTLALTGVVWLSQSLRFVDLIINRGLSFFTFVYLTFLLLPSFLAVLLPISLFCAVAYTYHRLSVDSEIVVLRSAGLSDMDLMKPALIMAGIMVALCYAMTLYLQPAGFREFKDRQFIIRADFSRILLQEGVFNNLGDGLTVYIRERLSNGEVRGILVHDNRNRAQPVTMMAERGVLLKSVDAPYLSLFKGNRQVMNRDRGKLSLLYFDRHNVDLSDLINAEGPRWREPRERYIDELFREPQDANETAYLAELRAEGHNRLLSPLYSLVMTLIALAALLGGEFNRRGRAARMIFAGAIAAAFQGLALGLTYFIVQMPWLTVLPYANVALWTAAALYLLLYRNKPRRRLINHQGPTEMNAV